MIPVTRTLSRKSAARVHSAGKARPVVIVLRPPGDVVGFRLLGTRTTYYLPVEHCYREALRAELARRKAERKKARSGKG